MKIIVFDLDGTVADLSHRLHLVMGKSNRTADWDGFFKGCIKDPPIKWMVKLYDELYYITGNNEAKFYFVSARSEVARDATVKWLNKHKLIYDQLLLRSLNDYRPDYEVKWDLIKGFKDDIWFAIDDSPKVVKMYRDNGVNVLQCFPPSR